MKTSFPVAILAGGLATRLRPLTDAIPKSLVPVCGEPFVAHQLRLVAAQGVRRAVICTGHLGHLVEQFVGDGQAFGLQVQYSHDGDRPLGTAGAIRRALPLLGDAFLTLYGDSYLPCPWQAVVQAFLDSDKAGLMTVFENQDRWGSSNVELADGRIVRYDKREKNPRMRHIDYGLGVFRSRAFADIGSAQPADLVEVYQRLLSRRDLAACEIQERFYEIGSFEGLREAEIMLRGRLASSRFRRDAA